ncbi:MAG: hypothetical protein M5R41_04965 [Bacteroidia bacterium]|nr:hypothetical protein [Bacteroidia bacterium]
MKHPLLHRMWAVHETPTFTPGVRSSKHCHTRCAIYDKAGDCVMPREGIFARVLNGGVINVDDELEVFPRDASEQYS